MIKLLMSVQLLFVIGALVTVALILKTPTKSDRLIDSRGIIQLLATGEQDKAEEEISWALTVDPKNIQDVFWQALLLRSRFDVKRSMPLFLKVLKESPDSLEAKASACIVGIDLSKKSTSALYYFNALLVLGSTHPDSISIHWMTGIMSRTLTRGSFGEKTYALPPEVNRQVQLCGVKAYEKTLALMAPGKGPVLIHQTFANMLDDIAANDQALEHRKIAVSLEPLPWSLDAAAETYLLLDRSKEALPLIREAISKEERFTLPNRIVSGCVGVIRQGTDTLQGSYPSLKYAAQVIAAMEKSSIPRVSLALTIIAKETFFGVLIVGKRHLPVGSGPLKSIQHMSMR